MTKQEMERVKRAVIRKYPIFASIALFNVPIEEDNRIPRAGVWAKEGKNEKLVLGGIKYNSDFFDNLSFNQQVFVMAHETCHIAFKHFERSLEKPKKDIDSRYQKYCESVSDDKLRKIELIKLEKKYYNYWNIATDACINAFLKKDGLEMPSNIIDKKTGMPMNFVDIADGLYRRAEAIYDSIVKKDNEKNNEEQDNQDNKRSNQNDQGSSNDEGNNNQDSLNDNGDNNKNGQGKQNNGTQQSQEDIEKKVSNSDGTDDSLDDFDIDDYQGIDSHEQWRGDQTNSKDKTDGQTENKDNQDKDKTNNDNESKSLLDKIKDFLGINKNKDNKDNTDDKAKTNEKNDDESPKKTEDKSEEECEKGTNRDAIDESSLFRENTKMCEAREKQSLSEALGNITKGTSIDDVSLVKPVLSWKQLLIGSIEEEEERWGYRRASRYMPNARIEDRIQDEKATTEIILDTSGSISEQLLKNFLYQLLPLFRETEIKVGCFAGKFHGFTELKTINQIKTFRPLRDNDGTNFEAAVKAFSHDNPSKRINKIVFTDGQLDYVASHRQQTKVDGIIWIVFGNKMNFKPLSGKVIRVSESDLSKTIGSITNTNFEILEENGVVDYRRRR